ncbi:TPA: DNA circularization protein [Enterobacter roggenkampii]
MAFFSSSPDWRDKLREASFRGVSFNVEDDDGEFGRRVQVHEYPGRDKPFTEDLGRATRRFTINAYLIGNDYADQRDRLISAIEAPGPGTLVHPHYGEMKGSIDGTVKVSHSNQEGRMCRVSFQFVESGELTFPAAGAATGKKLELGCDLLDKAVESAFGDYSLGGLPDFIQDDVINQAGTMLGVVSRAFEMVDGGISAAMRLLQGDVSVLLGAGGSGSNFVNALQRAWRSGERLTGDASDLVILIRTMSGVTVERGLAPRGVWPTDSGSLKAQKIRGNLIATAVRGTAISAAARIVTELPKPSSTSVGRAGGSLSGEGLTGGHASVNHPALDGGARQQSMPSPPTWESLTSIRTEINIAIEREQLRCNHDGLFLALSSIKARVNTDIAARLTQVEKTAERTPKTVMPALVLAAEWYDDASRERDILSRNRIIHPGFVPVMPVRGPVR